MFLKQKIWKGKLSNTLTLSLSLTFSVDIKNDSYVVGEASIKSTFPSFTKNSTLSESF